MIDRKAMEEVWATGPINWLKDHTKRTRGKTAYTIVARPYTKQYLDPVEHVVYASSYKAALKDTWELSKKVNEKYPREQYKDVAWSYGIKSDTVK